jgi:hypothetical protein
MMTCVSRAATEKRAPALEPVLQYGELGLPNGALGAVNQFFGGFVDSDFAESELIAKRTHHPGIHLNRTCRRSRRIGCDDFCDRIGELYG